MSPEPVGPWRAWRARLRNWSDADYLRRHDDKVLLVLTLVIGAVVGVVVVAFILLTEHLGSRFFPASGAAWRRLAFPLVGALVTGYLLQRYFPNARGSGIPQTKTALFLNDGVIHLRTALGKFGCSSVSLASGIALGREGPSVQVAAGIASVLGRRLGLGPNTVRALVPVGCSAALAAAFNTPIAAVLFTLEEVLGDLHAPVLGSIVLSSATSWAVLHLLLGDEPLFHVPAYQLVHPIEFANYAVLGLAGGLVSVAFVKLLLGLRALFFRMPPWSEWLQPAVGGLAVGAMAWFVPDVLGVGYAHVSEALNGKLVFGVMALLLVLKLVATAACYASGNAGGIFGPSLFIGAMLGGAVGSLAHGWLPDYTSSAGAYALIGMGTAFAGIIRAPMTSVIMIFEITRDYAIVVPVMIANLLAYLVSQGLQREPIYEALLHQDHLYLPPTRSRAGILTVSQVARPAAGALAAGDRVADGVLPAALGSLVPLDRAPNAWPVVGQDGRLLGMVTRAQLEQRRQAGPGGATLGELLPGPAPSPPLSATNFPHVHPDHPLEAVLRRMAASGFNVLPVVSRSDLRHLLGTIAIGDVLDAYATTTGEDPLGGPGAPERMSVNALLASVVVGLLGLFAVTGFLTHYYYLRRHATADRFFTEGVDLTRQGRDTEAIERYRNALSLAPSTDYRLALGVELLKSGRLSEATIYLREVLAEQPRNGPANLAMARIAVGQKQVAVAEEDYRRAIVGEWPENQLQQRSDATFELVEFLDKVGAQKRALAELLKLADAPGLPLAARERVGRMLLAAGSPQQSADLFREILDAARGEPDAWAGLGEAELAQDNYAAARRAFAQALHLKPGDSRLQQRQALCERVLSLDPTARGLSASERYARSRQVLESVLAAAETCATSAQTPLPDALRASLTAARNALADRRRPRSFGDASETMQNLAQEVWKAKGVHCGPTPPGDALARLLARIGG
jgi:CIC family chloride channel protein